MGDDTCAIRSKRVAGSARCSLLGCWFLVGCWFLAGCWEVQQQWLKWLLLCLSSTPSRGVPSPPAVLLCWCPAAAERVQFRLAARVSASADFSLSCQVNVPAAAEDQTSSTAQPATLCKGDVTLARTVAVSGWLWLLQLRDYCSYEAVCTQMNWNTKMPFNTPQLLPRGKLPIR